MVPLVLLATYMAGTVAGMATFTFFMLMDLLFMHLSPRIVLKWYKKEDHSPERVRHILEGLAKEAGIRCPKTVIFRSSLPIAFTVGRGRKHTVMVSCQALELLDDTELQVLLLREVGHIVHRDVFPNTVIAMVAGFLMLFPKAALWFALLTGFGQEEDPAPKIIGFLGAGLIAPLASLFVNLGLSPSQVMAADRYAAQHSSADIAAKTLDRVQKFMQLQPYEDVSPGHVHLYTLDPLRITSMLDVHLSLFRFHPKMQHRTRSMGAVQS
ncbi:M48 family metalloprotease [Methanomethylovorans sp.]|uniref:M48 family metalloprotease n=1 Tax=Methanomethylovorans sp. TaxID=2758717 RepID=UPI00345ED2F5